MRENLEKRLQKLKTEFESGQKVLAELEAKQANVRDTLLRISGAIQVLEEELAKADSHDGDEFPSTSTDNEFSNLEVIQPGQES
jgi:chromosome segregation ATPase